MYETENALIHQKFQIFQHFMATSRLAGLLGLVVVFLCYQQQAVVPVPGYGLEEAVGENVKFNQKYVVITTNAENCKDYVINVYSLGGTRVPFSVTKRSKNKFEAKNASVVVGPHHVNIFCSSCECEEFDRVRVINIGPVETCEESPQLVTPHNNMDEDGLSVVEMISQNKETIDKQFDKECSDKGEVKLVRFIFKDQASDWISAKTIRNLKDLRKLAEITIQGLPVNFVVFSEGKPLDNLADLPQCSIFRVLESEKASDEPIAKKRDKVNQSSGASGYSIFRTKNGNDQTETVEKLPSTSDLDIFEFDKNKSVEREICCLVDCLEDIDKNDIRENEEFWRPLTGFNLNRELLQHLYDQSKYVKNASKGKILLFGGKLVCKAAFASVTGKSLFCINQALQRHAKGIKRIIPRGNHPRFKPKSCPLISWMENVAIPKYGNNVPNKNEIRFPPSLSWKSLLLEYRERLALAHRSISPSIFYKAIDQNYGKCRDPMLNNPRIMIENRSSHGKCDLCAKIIEIRAKSTREEDIEFCSALEKDHRIDYSNERKAELGRYELCVQYPYKYLALCIDDNSHRQNGLPKPSLLTKSNNSWDKLDAHLTGTIATSGYLKGTRDVKFYYNLGNFLHQDTNKTVTILIQRLKDLDEKFKRLGKTLPGTLFLLSDNKSGELKNKFMLGFLAYLVKTKKFKKIVYSQLLCGHTEWHIDATFSPVKTAYIKSELATIEDFEKMLSNLNVPELDREVVRIDFTIDWIGTIAPKLVPISGHSSVQSFEITGNDEVEPVLRFKHRSTDPQYWPPQGFMIIRSGDWKLDDEIDVTGFRDPKFYEDFVQNTIVGQYVKHLTSSQEKKNMIVSSWKSHLTRLLDISENMKVASLAVDDLQDAVESNDSTLNEHLLDVTTRLNKKQQAAVTGSSFPVKIPEASYRKVSRPNQLVCVYTSSKVDRPWFALVSKVLDHQISLSWYRKVRNSQSKWQLTEEKDLVYFGSIMLWDFTQDVMDDFHTINVTKEILKVVRESYKNLDEQFKMKEKAGLNNCNKTVDFRNEHLAEDNDQREDDASHSEDDDSNSEDDDCHSENDNYQQKRNPVQSSPGAIDNDNSEQVINIDILENETRLREQREQFEKKMDFVDVQIEKLIKDDLIWRKQLKKRETQRNCLLEEADRILEVNDNVMDNSESIND